MADAQASATTAMSHPVAPAWRQPRLLIGLVVSLLCLVLAARNVSWAQLLRSLRDVHVGLLVIGMAGMILTWMLFALRWQLLFRAHGKMGWRESFAFVLVGYLGNLILPLRLGDITRLSLIARRYQVPLGGVVATGVLEKIFDLMGVLGIGALLTRLLPLPTVLQQALVSLAIVVAGGVALVWLIARSERWLGYIHRFFQQRLPQTIALPMSRTLDSAVGALRVLPSGRALAAHAGVNLLAWLVAALALSSYVQAFALPTPWSAGALVLVFTNLAGILPASPGSIGTYELLAAQALSLWVTDPSRTFAAALTIHTLNLLLSLLLGLAALWYIGLSPRLLRQGHLAMATDNPSLD